MRQAFDSIEDSMMTGLVNQSVNQSINLYRAIVGLQRRVRATVRLCRIKEKFLRRILNVLTDGAVRQFGGREFQSLGAATEKRRAEVFKLCGWTDRSFCVEGSRTHCRPRICWLDNIMAWTGLLWYRSPRATWDRRYRIANWLMHAT